MRYVLRHRIFSLGGDVAIQDETGQDRFIVDGKVFALGHKLIFRDLAGNELATIHQRLLSFRPTYAITRPSGEVDAVKKQISFFREHFTIDIPGPDDLDIEGDVFDHEYTVLRQGRPIAQVSKQWFSFTDAYGVDIAPGEDDVLLLASAIVIDLINEDREHQH